MDIKINKILIKKKKKINDFKILNYIRIYNLNFIKYYN